MSFPTIPPITPDIDIDRDQVINLILASIGLEELGLAHMINAAAEELQFILTATPVPEIEDVLKVERSVEKIMRDVIKKEIIMQFKLEDILTLPTTTTTTACECTLSTVSESEFEFFVFGDVNNPGDPFADFSFIELAADVCTISCNDVTDSAIIYYVNSFYPPFFFFREALFVADSSSLTVKCPFENQIEITGEGIVFFRDFGTGVVDSAFATFILEATDNNGAGSDTFRMRFSSSIISHDSGLVTVDFGDLTVALCPDAALAGKAIFDKTKALEQMKAHAKEIKEKKKAEAEAQTPAKQ